jgi:CHAT domain-containing protein
MLGDSYVQHFKVATRKGNIAQAMNIIERVRSRATVLDSGTVPQSDDRYATKSIEDQIADIQLKLMQSQPRPNRSELEDNLSLLEQYLALDSNSEVSTRQAVLTNPASLRTIQKILREDEEILEYVLDEPVSFCISVTRRKARVVAIEHGKANIEALADDYISRIRARKSVSALGKHLYSVLLPGPLLPAQSTRLIIIPDGKLHFLPFESLVDSTGGFLLQSHVVSYASSATFLRSLRIKSRYPRPRRTLLALGGVPYQDQMDAISANASRGLEQLFGAQLRNLPSTGDEVAALSKLFPEKTTVLLGAGATETMFKAQPLADFKILHLAVHALADDYFPDRAALILGHDKNSKDDGLLQAREIMALRLNADLVTLSACDTAFGKLEGEEGVRSLEEAFLIAGARSVVASLWNVEDHSTTSLMTSFYAHVAQGEGKAAALTHAKLDFIRDNQSPSPFYWAGFVMVGEGSSSVSFHR